MGTEELDRGDSVQAQLSNAVVRIMREYTGRGPTRARTVLDDDVVVVLCEETLTKGERVLAESGEGQSVVGMRRSYQQAMRRDLVTAVEKLTERRVRGFMSDQLVDPDMCAEVFVLEPAVRRLAST